MNVLLLWLGSNNFNFLEYLPTLRNYNKVGDGEDGGHEPIQSRTSSYVLPQTNNVASHYNFSKNLEQKLQMMHLISKQIEDVLLPRPWLQAESD